MFGSVKSSRAVAAPVGDEPLDERLMVGVGQALALWATSRGWRRWGLTLPHVLPRPASTRRWARGIAGLFVMGYSWVCLPFLAGRGVLVGRLDQFSAVAVVAGRPEVAAAGRLSGRVGDLLAAAADPSHRRSTCG